VPAKKALCRVGRASAFARCHFLPSLSNDIGVEPV
jgi:hypothetical protein